MSIFDTNDEFDFNKLTMLTPTVIPGGNYFIRFKINQSPLYIQPPQCKSKQAMVKSGKKIFCDLMFTNEDEGFIRWMENLETHCKNTILKNKDKWLETDLDKEDIENSFTSPLKIFKSGKFYIVRTYIPNHLGVCPLTVYNEYEEELPLDEIQENTELKTILEIQGIKCSVKNFQIEIEMKQVMVIKPKNLFSKCLFSTNSTSAEQPTKVVSTKPSVTETPQKVVHENEVDNYTEDDASLLSPPTIHDVAYNHENVKMEVSEKEPSPPMEHQVEQSSDNAISVETVPEKELQKELQNELMEVEFNLEKIPETDTIELVPTTDIYYKMYKDAKKRAKAARDLAISSYLEAMRIKNTHLLDELEDDDEDEDDDLDESMDEMTKI